MEGNDHMVRTISNIQAAFNAARERIATRNERDERGLEAVATLLIIMGVAVIVGVAILTAVKTGVWGVQGNTNTKLGTSVSTFVGT